MADFQAFLNGVLGGIPQLAHDTLGQLPAQAQSDVQGLLTYSRANLALWGGQLARGEMSRLEFEDLADDLVDLGQLVGLSDLGIAKAALQRFRDGLVKLLVDTAMSTFVPG